METLQKHETEREWGRNSTFWGFEKGDGHRIERSSDLDYPRPQNHDF